MSIYNPGIPNGTVNLDQDYINIKNNFSQANTSFGVDHVAFSVASNNGYHNAVHLTSQSPSAISTIGILYSNLNNDGINNDTSLCFLTGGNRTIQLTRNITPRANTNGYSYIPGPFNNNGAILVQWGVLANNFSSGSTKGTVTFPIPFPNNLFIVTGNPTMSYSDTPSSQASVNIRASSLGSGNTLSFDYQFYTNSGDYTGFTWYAIGN